MTDGVNGIRLIHENSPSDNGVECAVFRRERAKIAFRESNIRETEFVRPLSSYCERMRVPIHTQDLSLLSNQSRDQK
jgi:hypothetical protein